MDNRLSLPDEEVGGRGQLMICSRPRAGTQVADAESLRAWKAQFPALGPYPHAIGSPGLGSTVSVQALAKGNWPSGPPTFAPPTGRVGAWLGTKAGQSGARAAGQEAEPGRLVLTQAPACGRPPGVCVCVSVCVVAGASLAC